MISISWFADAKTIAQIKLFDDVLYEHAVKTTHKVQEIKFSLHDGLVAEQDKFIGMQEIVISRAIAQSLITLMNKR